MDWKKLEKFLMTGIHAELKIDDDILKINVQRSKMKLIIMVWVNGKYNGEDSAPASIIGRKYYFPMMVRPYKAQAYKQLTRVFGKRSAPKNDPILACYSPNFKSFSSLKKMLLKHQINWINEPED